MSISFKLPFLYRSSFHFYIVQASISISFKLPFLYRSSFHFYIVQASIFISFKLPFLYRSSFHFYIVQSWMIFKLSTDGSRRLDLFWKHGRLHSVCCINLQWIHEASYSLRSWRIACSYTASNLSTNKGESTYIKRQQFWWSAEIHEPQ